MRYVVGWVEGPRRDPFGVADRVEPRLGLGNAPHGWRFPLTDTRAAPAFISCQFSAVVRGGASSVPAAFVVGRRGATATQLFDFLVLRYWRS